MTYSEKLESPLWQKKRLEIMNRDNWTCQHCGTKTTQLQIHHLDYWKGLDPWEYPADMLITVCKDCHKEENIRFKHEQYLLQSFLQNGFLANDLLAFSTMVSTNPGFRKELLNKIRKYAQS